MFKFTIREVVLLTLAVGIGLGWYLDQRSLRRQVNSTGYSYEGKWNAVVNLIEDRGGKVGIGKGTLLLYLKPGTPSGWTEELLQEQLVPFQPDPLIHP